MSDSCQQYNNIDVLIAQYLPELIEGAPDNIKFYRWANFVKLQNHLEKHKNIPIGTIFQTPEKLREYMDPLLNEIPKEITEHDGIDLENLFLYYTITICNQVFGVQVIDLTKTKNLTNDEINQIMREKITDLSQNPQQLSSYINLDKSSMDMCSIQ